MPIGPVPGGDPKEDPEGVHLGYINGQTAG
jgi:hypothetical protein